MISSLKFTSIPNYHILILVVDLIVFTHELIASSNSGDVPSFYPNNNLVVNSFTIKSNTIIRTSDSLNSGAKYLMEAEKSSNEQCVLWCWDNRNCTLAVYEEKNQGSCYLFDCGPSDQVKCKFTGHDNYTSSLVKFARNSVELNNMRNQMKHESDLVNLRISVNNRSDLSKNLPYHVKNQPNMLFTSTTLGSLIPPPSSQVIVTSTSATINDNLCKRHQFRCRNSSECIAIYNICDGIIQCQDGSDEDPSLRCPESGSYPRSESQVPEPPASKNLSPGVSDRSQIFRNIPYSEKSENLRASEFNSGQPVESRIPLANDGRYFTTKNPPLIGFNYPKNPDLGSKLADQLKDGKQSMPSNYNDFIHRNQFEEKNFYPNQYYSSGPMSNGRAYRNQYYQAAKDYYSGPRSRNYLGETDYPNSYVKDFPYYRRSEDQRNWYAGLDSSQNQQPPLPPTVSRGNLAWQQANGLSLYPPQRLEIYPNSIDSPPASKVDPSEKEREIKPLAPVVIPSTERPITVRRTKTQAHSTESELKVQKVKQLPANSESSHLNPSRTFSRLNSDKLSQSINAPVAVSHLSSHETGRDTNSAVIALVLGLVITGILAALVVYRMKYIRRRIARRGRNLAHDADYLVNGMYL